MFKQEWEFYARVSGSVYAKDKAEAALAVDELLYHVGVEVQVEYIYPVDSAVDPVDDSNH